MIGEALMVVGEVLIRVLIVVGEVLIGVLMVVGDCSVLMSSGFPSNFFSKAS